MSPSPRRSAFWRWTLLAGMVLMFVACQPSTEEARSTDELVLATFESGVVTLGDLDQHLTQAASTLVWDTDLGTPEQLGEWTRRVAVERIALSLAEQEEGIEEAVERRVRDIKRRAATRQVLATQPPAPPLERSDLEAYFEAQRERIDRPERRRVAHLFLRHGDDRNREALEERLGELRQRALSGENFGLLARDFSDSESRHREGALGEVVRGQFSEDFDEVVFGLEERELSEPIFTADGGHLFLVTDIFPERRFTFEEVGAMLLREMLAERLAERLRETARELLEARGEELLPDEYFERLLSRGRPPAVLFRVGEMEFRPADFRRLIQQTTAREQAREEPSQRLREAYYQEVILQYGTDEEEISAAELETERQRALVDIYLDSQLRQRLEADEERIRRHYDRHVGRFSRPVLVSLSRLRMPVEKVDSPLMGRLEAAREELDAGPLSLEDLAAQHGGQIDDVSNRSVAQLRAQDPMAVKFAFALQPGQHSPPYTWGGQLLLFRLDSRQEAEVRPLDQVRAEVMEDYLRTQGQELYLEYSEELLAEHAFEIDEERLARGAGLLARLP